MIETKTTPKGYEYKICPLIPGSEWSEVYFNDEFISIVTGEEQTPEYIEKIIERKIPTNNEVMYE